MINVLYNFLQSNALNFAKTFAIHAFDRFIPNHVSFVIFVSYTNLFCSYMLQSKEFILKNDLFISTILPNIVLSIRIAI